MADVPAASLSVAIGESVFRLAARAPGVIRPERMDDNSPAVIAQPVQLTVYVQDQALPLPPTRFAQIDQVAGVVTGVDTAPMLDFAGLESCNTLAARLVAHAKASGWTVVESYPVDVERMREQIAKAERPRYEKTYAVLRRGGTDLRVYLKEAAGAGLEKMDPPARGRLFLVNTDFSDAALSDTMNERLFARRRQVTGDTRSIPLSAWAEH